MAVDLIGNWSWTVWLLIPLILVLAILTARTLGASGEPPGARGGTRGVSHYLVHHASTDAGDHSR